MKKLLLLLLSSTLLLSGCSKYEKDMSYDTDLYGSYSREMGTYNDDSTEKTTEESSFQYYSEETYQFNLDNTYQLTGKVISDGTTQNIDEDGKILSVEEISDNISSITLDEEVWWSSNESSNQVMYKYKNMIGDFFEVEVPKGKTFELQLNDARYDKEGQYHLLCDGSDNCNCSDSWPKYIRKDNIIYFQSMDEEHKNYYTINLYIVDNGLFCPIYYKTE